MMSLDIEKNGVQLTETNKLSPHSLMLILEPLWTWETTRKVFHTERQPDLASFCVWIAKRPAYLVWCGKECFGLLWFDAQRSGSVEVSFMANPERYKLDYLKAGQAVLDILLESNKNQAIHGFIADFNGKALDFVLKLGFKESGKIPNGVKNIDGALCDLHIVSINLGEANG